VDVEVRLLLGGHAPVTGDLTRYDLDNPGAVPIVEPDTRAIAWADLPAVSVAAPDDRPLREVFEEAFALFQRDQGLAYHGGHHQTILFSLYAPGFEENVLAEMTSDWTFGLDPEGRLLLDDDRLERLTIGDVRRAARSGLTDRDPHRLLAYEVYGEADVGITGTITAFLNEHWEFLVPYALGAAYKANAALRNRRIRQQVAQWHRQGIHDPWQIRAFLARRNAWTPAQVAKLVSLDEESAARLLTAMGYLQLDTGLYVLGQTDEAKKARDDWEKAERRAEFDG
jgi:hypothetical protein